MRTRVMPAEGAEPATRRSRPAWLAFAIAVVVGVVAAVVAFAVEAGQTAEYQSVATLAIDQPAAIAVSGDAGIVGKLAALRYKYTGLLTTEEFARPVATRLHLSTGAVRGALFASAPPNALVFQVGARTTSATGSHTLAAAAADEVVSYVQNEQETAGIPVKERFTVRVVTPASPGAQVAPTRKRELGAAGLAGLVAFAAVLAVAAIRSRDT